MPSLTVGVKHLWYELNSRWFIGVFFCKFHLQFKRPYKSETKTYPINFVSPRIKEANVHKASYVNQKNSLPSSNGVSLGLRRNRKNCWKGSFMLPYGTGCNWNVLAIQVHSKFIIIYLPEDNSVPNHNVVITRSSANTVWGLVWNSRKLKQKARSLKNN